MSIAKGFAQAALKTAQELQCNAMQIFTKSPRGGSIKPIDPQDARTFKQYCREFKIEYVIAHSSYLLNFAKLVQKIPWMFQNILSDFERLHILGGKGVVIHIGKSLDGERIVGIQNVIENAKYIVDKTVQSGMEYILENTAGQGSEIGFRFEELGQIWKGLKGFSPRIRSCLDTAHVWAAGYDISSAASVQKVLKEYDELIGLKTLSCFHFNDSKKPLESHLDRHENIGDGTIGLEGLKAIAEFANKNNIPMILETPESAEKTHLDDVKIVRKFNMADIIALCSK